MRQDESPFASLERAKDTVLLAPTLGSLRQANRVRDGSTHAQHRDAAYQTGPRTMPDKLTGAQRHHNQKGLKRKP